MTVRRSGQGPPEWLRQPAYALAQLHQALHGRLEQELADQGLSLRMHQALVCIEENHGGSQQQVSNSVEVDRSEMVRIIDRLEKQRMVVRERDPDDRRRYRLRLTVSGRRALRIAERVLDRVTAESLAGLSAGERRTLHDLTLRALGKSAG